MAEEKDIIDTALPVADAAKEAARITAMLDEDDKESAGELLSSFSVEKLNAVLCEMPSEYRADAILTLDDARAVELIRSAGDDPEDNFLREMNRTDTARVVVQLFSKDPAEAVIDLPSFVVQQMLAHDSGQAKQIIEESIEYLMTSKQLALLKSVLVELNPVDIASILDDFKTEDLLKIFRILPKDMATDVFVYLPSEVSQDLIKLMSDTEAGRLIDDLYADDAADLLEEMPSMVVKRLLAKTKPETRAAVNHLLQYKDDSAGSIMTVEFVDLKEYYTVEQAIAVIRKTGIDSETINNCFVLDAERKLLGIVTLRKLLLSDPAEKVGDLMEENVIIVRTNTDQEEVARLFKKYDFIAMPVCDSENRLVGIVTVDDIVDIIEEETEEDFSRMAAMAPIEDAYLKTPVRTLARSRILWLLFLMISATLSGQVINSFGNVMSTFLYSFTPLLMGTAGNCGSQASTTVIRALALDQIAPKDFVKVGFKEVRVALLCSIVLAVANTVRIILMYWWVPEYADYHVALLQVSLISGVSLIAIIVIAQLLGSLLPLIAKKLHVDPALMSAPVISTIMDTLSILIYCLVIVITTNTFGWMLP